MNPAAKIIGLAKWLLWPEDLGTEPPAETASLFLARLTAGETLGVEAAPNPSGGSGASLLGTLLAWETLGVDPAGPADPAPPGMLRSLLALEQLGPPGPEPEPAPPSLLRRLIARESLSAESGPDRGK